MVSLARGSVEARARVCLFSVFFLAVFCEAAFYDANGNNNSKNVVVVGEEFLSLGRSLANDFYGHRRRHLLQADPFRPCPVNFTTEPHFDYFDTMVKRKCPVNPAMYVQRHAVSYRRCCPPFFRALCKYTPVLNAYNCAGDSFFDELKKRNFSSVALPIFCLYNSTVVPKTGYALDCTLYNSLSPAPAPAPSLDSGDGESLGNPPIGSPDSAAPPDVLTLGSGQPPPPTTLSGLGGPPPIPNLGSLNPPPQSGSRRTSVSNPLLAAGAICAGLVLPLMHGFFTG